MPKKKKQKLTRIMVLNDGETYTEYAGCYSMGLTLAGMEMLEAGFKAKDLPANVIVHMHKMGCGEDYEE